MAATSIRNLTIAVFGHDGAAEALFSASLREGAIPTGDEAEHAIWGEIGTYGIQFCAGRVAAEYGEHSEVAVPRMKRVLAVIDALATN